MDSGECCVRTLGKTFWAREGGWGGGNPDNQGYNNVCCSLEMNLPVYRPSEYHNNGIANREMCGPLLNQKVEHCV